MRAFDNAVLHTVQRRERRHDLASGEHLDLELAARHVLDKLREGLGSAVDCVEGLREAMREAPAHRRLCVLRWRKPGGESARDTGALDERPTIDSFLPSCRFSLGC